MSRILAALACATVVSAADATISADWEYFGTETLYWPHETVDIYRIMVDVADTPPDDSHGWLPGPDDWTAGGLDLAVSGSTFYDDPRGGNPPNPLWFDILPGIEWDTYYTSPSDWPNEAYSGATVGIAHSADTDVTLDTDWFDVIDSGNGRFVIAQVAVFADAVYSLDGILHYAAANSGGALFTLPIPEPGALALLALGAGALRRRR